MDLQKSDLTARIHKESLLLKIESDEKNFNSLLKWSLLEEQPLAWRATWLLRLLTRKEDHRLSQHVSKVIDQFPQFNTSQKREWLKILVDQQYTEEEEGLLFDRCIEEWKNIHNQSALRASAFQIILGALEKYPELKNELNHLMESEYMEGLSPGIKKGVVKRWNIYRD